MIYENLTEKQSRLFRFILDYVTELGHYPSYQTITEETWINSKNGVYQYINALESKGYLARNSGGKYALHAGKKHLLEVEDEQAIPIRGIIAAGGLREAVDADLGRIGIRDLFPKAKDPFGARVKGNSMTELGIHEGDIVFLDKTEVKNNDIGALLYNGETTLKKVRIENENIRLLPFNPEHEPIVIKPGEFEEVTVIGKYLAHLHRGKLLYAS